MPNVTVYDRKGNKIVLEAVGNGSYEMLDAGGNGTGSLVNLKSALACDAYFTEEQHERFLAKQKKAKGK